MSKWDAEEKIVPISAKRRIIVVTDPIGQMSYNLIFQSEKRMTSLFKNKGISLMYVTINKDTFLPGEAIAVNVDIFN